MNENNKRIAKNTLVLYVRMGFLMCIGLYTSRITLNALGIDNYGIYNVVGSIIAMFSIFTSSLTAAISRSLTVELGKGNFENLKKAFFTSLFVLIIISIIIAILSEAGGLWFLYNKMKIPSERIYAAEWVLHCSIASFAIGLISIPYNSIIVAHERMSAFAYIGIFEASMKLIIAYSIYISPFDKLITFSTLLLIVQLILRMIYGIYCGHHFIECRGHLILDKYFFKDIGSFASWNILTNGAYLMNTQGVNMIMNVFFGVVVNAARGIANQVNNIIFQFVNNFTMAINPQLIKIYSAGNKDEAFKLAYFSAKMAYFLMFIISLPIVMEANFFLSIWLKNPPNYSTSFTVWTILSSLCITLGTPLVTLIMADGKIKKYQIIMFIFGIIPFPLSWYAFYLGCGVEWAYYIFFLVYYILIYIRMWLAHEIVGISYNKYIKDVLIKTHLVTIISVIIPLFIKFFMNEGVLRVIIITFLCIPCSIISIFYWGLSYEERETIINKIKKRFYKKIVNENVPKIH